MNDEDEKFSLRDRFAISIFEKFFDRYKDEQLYHPDTYDISDGHMEILSDISYRVADIMRKSRLKSFT